MPACASLELLLAAALAALAAGCGVSSDVSRELGARCGGMEECDQRCLVGGRFPGGFCSATCEDDGDCPDGAACADVEGGVCLFDCDGASACDFLGTGWACGSESAVGGAGEVMVCVGDS